MLLAEIPSTLRRAVIAAAAVLGIVAAQAHGQTILVDFGNSSTYRGVTTPGNWNSVGFGYTGNLIDTNGVATTIDYAPDGLGGTDSFNSIVGATSDPPTAVQISNAQSAVSGSPGSLAAGEAAIDFFRSDNGTTGVGRFQLQQAVTGLTYDLTFYGSKQYVNASNTQTKYSVFNDSSYSSLLSSGTLTTGTTGAAGNPSSTVTLVGLAAPTNANAIFYIQWEGLSNSTFGYISSMSVSGYAAYGGGGTTNISTAKTYNAPTFITNGTTVNAEVAGALPTNAATTLTISGAGSTLNAGASQTVASLSGGAGTTIAVSNGASFTVANADTSSHAGVLAGSGTLIKTNSGSLNLSASNSFSGTATVAGGTLTVSNVDALRNATLDTGSSGSQTVSLGLAGNNTYNLGGLAGADNLALDGNSLNVGGTVATTYSGALSGTGSLVKSGTGTLGLSGANTHSGGTIISAGRLNINNASALGSGTLTLSNGASFNNTSGGAISNANNNAISMGGTNTFAGSSSLDLGSGNVTLNEATRLNVSSGDLTLRGTISGSAGFNKDGIGTLTLAGSNAMTSYTVLDYGVLNLANADALANAQLYLYGSSSNRMVVFGAAGTNAYKIGALSSSGTGTLTLGANSVDVGRANETTTFSGVVEGSGSLAKSGSGTFTLSGANTHSGGTTLSAGQLNVNNASALGTGTFTLGNGTKINNTSGGAISNANNNSLSLAGTNTFLGSSSLNLGTGTVTLGGNSQLDVTGGLRLGGNVSGSSTLTKAGNGTLTLAGTNFGSSQLVVTAGTLTLTDANRGGWTNSTGAIRLEGGTLSMINGNNLGAYPGAGGVQVQFAGNSTLRFDGSGSLLANRGFAISNGVTASIDSQGFTPTMNNVVQGGGALNKVGAGALSLGGANTYSGGTTLTAGQLNLNNASALGTGTFTIASGTTFDNTSAGAITNTQNNAIVLGSTNTFAGTRDLHLGNGNVTFSGNTRLNVNANNLTLGGNLSGADAFNKDGIGTLTLAGSNSMTSFTVVDYGILNLANVDALANAQLYLYGSASNKMVTFGAAGTNTYNIGALSGASDGTLSLGANSVNVGAGNLTTTFNGVIEGTGLLIKSGTGSLTLANANTYSGGTLINGGTLLAGHAQAFGGGSVTIGLGTILDLGSYTVANSLINNGGIIYSTGTLDNISASSGTTDIGGSNSQIASISGTATVNVTGTGVQINTMSGGNLNVGATGAAVTNFTGGNIGVSNGVTVALREGNSSGAISGAGAIEKLSSGTLTLSGNNSHAGGTTLSSGRLNINSTSALGTGAFTLGNGASFNNTSGGAISNANNNAVSIAGTNTFAGTDNLHLGTGNVSLAAASRLIVSSGALTLGGSVSGSAGFNKDGGGKLTLTGSNAMTSYTVVDFGILELGNVNALANAQLYLYGSSSNKMVTFGVAGGNTYNLGALSGSATGVLTLGGNSVSVGANNVATTYAGTIEGTGGVTKTGSSTLTLAGTNTYSGATTVSSGKLVINGATASSSVTIANGAEVGGNGTSGTLTVQTGGTIAPGNSAGTFNINGDIVWQNGGSYDWEIFNLAGPAGSGWDLIDATGSLDLNGLTGASDFVINLFSLSTNNVTAGTLAGFDANANYDWMIASFSGLSGSFDLSKFTVNTAGFTTYNSVGAGLFALEVSEAEDSLYLTYRAGGAPVPEPGTWAAAALLLAAAGLRWRRRQLAARE